MRRTPTDLSGPTVVAVVLAIAIGGTIVIAGATGGAAFDPFNLGWEGLSELREMSEDEHEKTHLATDIESYDDAPPAETVALIVQPQEYTPTEQERLREFVEQGGTVVIATRDPIPSTPLLEALGTDVRVDGDPLRDEREYWITPDFPLVTDVANHSSVNESAGMSLNHGTALVDTEDARVLANSSSYSYLDREGDGGPTDNDTLASYPVVATESIADGEVLVVSDPSIFINAMLDRSENRAFASNVLAEHDQLLLDRTADGVPPLVSVLLAIRGSIVLSGLLVVLLLTLVFAFESGRFHRPGDSRRAPDGTDVRGEDLKRDTLETYIEAEHADRDRARLERVLGGVFTRQEQNGNNE